MLPMYFLVVSFGLVRIAQEHGPIEIAPGTHRMMRTDALRAVETGEIGMQALPLEIADVLIRHRWALHRGTPNMTDLPRALATIRYVRRWYADASRDMEELPRATWESLTDRATRHDALSPIWQVEVPFRTHKMHPRVTIYMQSEEEACSKRPNTHCGVCDFVIPGRGNSRAGDGP